jgi:hypothetical protein
MIEKLIVTALSKRQTQRAVDTYSQIRGKETPFCSLFTAQWLHAQEKT